ncbi:MAG: hypothetical protein HY042_08340 [Spirochaetia bacterium]|nr:hypothetical protein [Spirochaetia bacterium]
MKVKGILVCLLSLVPALCSAKEPHELIVGRWVLVGHHCDMATHKCEPIPAGAKTWEEEFKADGMHSIKGDTQTDKYFHKYEVGKDTLTITTFRKGTGKYVTTLKVKMLGLDDKFLYREQFGETYILKLERQK